MLEHVEVWITEAQKTGLLDWNSLREAVRKDIANQQDGGVCSVCLHKTHQGKLCTALVPDEERPFSDRGIPCDCDGRWSSTG
jgi:hypothetical protein